VLGGGAASGQVVAAAAQTRARRKEAGWELVARFPGVFARRVTAAALCHRGSWTGPHAHARTRTRAFGQAPPQPTQGSTQPESAKKPPSPTPRVCPLPSRAGTLTTPAAAPAAAASRARFNNAIPSLGTRRQPWREQRLSLLPARLIPPHLVDDRDMKKSQQRFLDVETWGEGCLRVAPAALVALLALLAGGLAVLYGVRCRTSRVRDRRRGRRPLPRCGCAPADMLISSCGRRTQLHMQNVEDIDFRDMLYDHRVTAAGNRQGRGGHITRGMCCWRRARQLTTPPPTRRFHHKHFANSEYCCRYDASGQELGCDEGPLQQRYGGALADPPCPPLITLTCSSLQSAACSQVRGRGRVTVHNRCAAAPACCSSGAPRIMHGERPACCHPPS
jgi:hypothetical protein